jgi:hypothetical protein
VFTTRSTPELRLRTHASPFCIRFPTSFRISFCDIGSDQTLAPFTPPPHLLTILDWTSLIIALIHGASLAMISICIRAIIFENEEKRASKSQKNDEEKTAEDRASETTF